MHLAMIALIAGSTHFLVPLGYYVYLKRNLSKPWRLNLDYNFSPSVTIMIPTFNEASLIEKKLDDIKAQMLSAWRMEIILVDSGSTDGTAQIATEWSLRNPEVDFTVITESTRRGKAYALNTGLHHAKGDIFVMTDADSSWVQNSLTAITQYFSDSSVGAVTGLKQPLIIGAERGGIEPTYRSFYNIVRLAESKIHSTPVFNGELAAFRRYLLVKNGGFPTDVGADDSHAATLLALNGYRAIAIPEALIHEFTPSSRIGYLMWKKRRALHLVQHFVRSISDAWKASPNFRKVLRMETYLHVVNPWLLLMSFVIFLLSVMIDLLSPLNLGIILAALLTQVLKPTRRALRAWIIEQMMLLFGSLTGLFSRELVWGKIEELRSDS